MEKQLERIQGKSVTIQYVLVIVLTLMAILSAIFDYSKNQLLFIYMLIAIILIDMIVAYYGELIISENSLLNHIPISRIEIVRNYSYNLSKLQVLIALFLGWSLIDIRHYLFKVNIIYGAIFIGIILFTINNLSFSFLILVETRLRNSVLNIDNKMKNIIIISIVLVQGLIFTLIYYMARKIPLVVETRSMELVKSINFMPVKYNYIRTRIFFSIYNESYVNLTFLLIVLLMDSLALLGRKYYKGRFQCGE